MTSKASTGTLTHRFWILTAFIALIFLTGGSSRSEVQSLAFLRPVAVAVCGIALLSLQKSQVQSYKTIFIVAICFVMTAIFQLVPLPFFANLRINAIPEIGGSVELGSAFQEISVAPFLTKNFLYSLSVPIGVLLLGVQLNSEERFALLPLLLTFGLISAFVGVIQIFSDPTGLLYLYETTNRGASVGFFANRNHQALLLAMVLPTLCVYISTQFRSEHQRKLGEMIGITASLVIILLILIVGSRAGLFLGLIAAVGAFTLYRQNRALATRQRPLSLKTTIAIAFSGLMAFTFVSVVMARAKAFDRLMAPDQGEDLRFQIWSGILNSLESFLPFGSGAGTFATIYRKLEVDGQLTGNYANQAHSELLDLPLTMGAPGTLVAATFFVMLMLKLVSVLRGGSIPVRHVLYQKLGLILLLMIFLSSLVDYPLRTPIIATFFTVALLWIYADAERIR